MVVTVTVITVIFLLSCLLLLLLPPLGFGFRTLDRPLLYKALTVVASIAAHACLSTSGVFAYSINGLPLVQTEASSATLHSVCRLPRSTPSFNLELICEACKIASIATSP